MAFPYNSFPVGYQPAYMQHPYPVVPPQPAQAPVQQPQPAQQTSQITWVQGESGAKSYMVPPNMTIPLWDSEDHIIYIKTTNAAGMPTMQKIRYTIEEDAPAQIPPVVPVQQDASQFVSREEFESRVSELLKMIDGMRWQTEPSQPPAQREQHEEKNQKRK